MFRKFHTTMQPFTRHMLLLLLLHLGCLCHGQDHGPVFLQEPPSRLVFSNSTGASAPCSAHGFPPPTISWHLIDGSPVSSIPGLRIPMDNGSLVFLGFPAQDYRQDVHGAAYRCRAANSVGVVLSREMHVTAVVWQEYNVQVSETQATVGSTAILSCLVPSAVKDYVTVNAWYKDESMLLPRPSDTSGRYVVTGTQLHIRNVKPEDAISRYSCSTENSLTNERRRSSPTKLQVVENVGTSAPRITSQHIPELTAKRGADIHMSCAAEGNPSPTVTWVREIEGVLREVQPSLRISVSPDLLSLRRVEPSDAGRWGCRAQNALGERIQETRLIVTSHLSAHLHPQLQIVNSGGTATLNCSVSGEPLGPVQWLHDGIPVGDSLDSSSGDGRARVQGALNFVLTSVRRSDAGMYQCFVRNEMESAQASAELRLGDTAPELQYTFIEQALRSSSEVSLRCSAAGAPPPRFQWLLDGQPLTSMSRGLKYQIGQFLTKNGEVVSHLNISNARSEDGGLYSCKASNPLGDMTHTARLNIYGPPYVRSISPIRAVAGREIVLYCPYSGYPISSVKWERSNGNTMPSSVTSHSGPEGSLIISRVESSHAGAYICIVTAADGQHAKRDIQLIVNNPPEIEPFSFPGNLQEGRRAQVSCSVTAGDMPVYFSWHKDGSSIPASLQVEERGAEFFSNLVFKDVSSRHSGLYTCVASNSAAKVNFTAELIVKVPPKWINEPQDTASLAGGILSLHCKTRGSPPPQITWLKQQGQIGSDFSPLVNLGGRFKFMSNGTMLIEAASSYDEGQYMCRADNGIGTPLSKVIYVSVNEPARFETSSKNVTARRNEPITLVCDVIGDNPIQIQWTHNMNRLDLNTYRLSTSEVKTDSGLRSQLFISRTDRQDSGVYKCQAINAFGHSDHLIYLSVQEKPDPPHSLVVLEVGSRSARLGWSQGFDGNSPLLGYAVQHSPLHVLQVPIHWEEALIQNISIHSLIKGPTKNNVIASPNEQNINTEYEAIVSGLQPHNSYAVRIQAINQIDQSEFTEPVIVKTQEEAPSEPPHNIQIQTAGPGELHVSWQAPPRESWNGDLLGYTVTWYELSPGAGITNTSRSATVNGWSSTELTLTGLKKFTRYGIVIKPFNGVAAGPTSPPATATTLEGVPEAAPLGVSCVPLSAVGIKVSWRPPPVAQHGGLIQGYKVLYTPQLQDHVEYNIGEVKRISNTETYIHGLHKYTNYSIQLLAYTNAGDGKRSSPVFCTTNEDTPSPPHQIKVLAMTGESILVSWLPPLNPNGIISLYTVYHREAGRIGKHSSHTVSIDNVKSNNLMYEVKNLAEHQFYEFWVSATTGSGEGEPTTITAQSANVRAPARIASFSQVIRKPVGSQVILTCYAVGNPSPRARWLHRQMTVTHTSHYQVTPDGNLNIHKLDQTSSGNFTCTASNPFGEDSITYTVIAILPPAATTLGLQFTTASTIKIQWQPPNDGGSPILGYSLFFKTESETTWQVIELSPEANSFTLESLKCGTLYMIKLQAHNRVAMGSVSEILSTSTRGSVPRSPKPSEFITSNATSIKLNLYTWRDGGCPISKIRVEYRLIGEQHWIVAAEGSMIDNLVLSQLVSAQWYQLKLALTNDAGTTNTELHVDTTKENGGRIPPLDPSIALAGEVQAGGLGGSMLLPVASAILLLTALFLLGCLLLKTRKFRCLLNNRYSRDDRKLSESNELEREKLREGQKLYSSSSINGNEKSNDDSSELYEISPYATFGTATGGRNSGGEHALHFRTFGMPDNEAGPARLPTNHRKHRRLHRCDTFEYDESTLSKAMTVEMRTNHFIGLPSGRSSSAGKSLRGTGPSWERRKHRDPPTTDSDDNSDSPGNTTTKGSRCASPLNGERSYTPGRLQMARCSSIYLNGRGDVESNTVRVTSPHPGCDSISNIAVPPDITVLIDKYHQKKEQERRECTIHV